MIASDEKDSNFKDNITNVNTIKTYIECEMCLNEWRLIVAALPEDELKKVENDKMTPVDFFLDIMKKKPYNTSTELMLTKIKKNQLESDKVEDIDELLIRWVQLNRYHLGWTRWGIQVWCPTHNVNIMHVDFEGQKHPGDFSRQKRDEELI